MDSWLTLVPPLLAIAMAILSRQVIPSLLVGVFSGALIIHGNLLSGFQETINIVINVFSDAGNTRIIIFSLLIGAILQLVEYSGGAQGFVKWISNLRFMKTQKQTGFMAIFVGALLFIESNISILTVGTIFRPIFARLKISAQKLAYIADSSCAPIKVLIPFNAWGAYLITQIGNNGVAASTSVFASSIPFFIYPICAIVLVVFSIMFSLNLGEMKRFEGDAQKQYIEEESENVTIKAASPSYFVIPMVTLIFGVFLFMFITGNGILAEGSGSKSVLYSVILSLVVIYGLFKFKRQMTGEDMVKQTYKGMANMHEIAMVMVMAFAINALCKELGTGIYIAKILGANVSGEWIPAMLFIVSAFVSFSTGTSWGTFAIMLGIGVPVALELGLHVPLIVGAVVSGGIWGDHSSPISDTTVLSSLAAGTSHIDHVKSQFPYALLGGALSIILFTLLGFILI
jgi:Na+/H+ antiporter NhaC